MKQESVQIIIAHYGGIKKITEAECIAALPEAGQKRIFVDFPAGDAALEDLYEQPFENLALAQRRHYADKLKPLLDAYPAASIVYFGFAAIPLAFHLGYMVGNTHDWEIYQWHHQSSRWYVETTPPREDYAFGLKPTSMPLERQRGKGDVVIRIGTSFAIDPQSTAEAVPAPANEFTIELATPHQDSLSNQDRIRTVVNAFQDVLNAYSSKLTDREQIHLFISSSAGLPFALGTIVNSNMYPYIQTYQYSKDRTPKHRAAILVARNTGDRVLLTDAEKQSAAALRKRWEDQLQQRIKPFIGTIVDSKPEDWLKSVCGSPEDYAKVAQHLKSHWISIPDIGRTSLRHDRIDLDKNDINQGFEYIEKTNLWLLDDGFLVGLDKRLSNAPQADVMQAGRLFLFHEGLHYCKDGHRLTGEIAANIGQFPKVIEEADYQADVWGLLNEYRYCKIYEPGKLKDGLKQFFCNAIDTAVETMWSFVGDGSELKSIQIRSMNRFLNWYWQLLLIEDLDGTGSLADIVSILFNKPVVEFAGAPMQLIGHRTFFKLSSASENGLQLAAFAKNRVSRFTPTAIDKIVSGFRMLDGDKVKEGLKSFQVTLA